RSRWLKERGDFNVVANAGVDGELASHAPGILSEDADRDVIEGLAGVADALDVGLRNTEAIGLATGEGRDLRAERRDAAEVDVAAKIELEDLRFGRAKLNQVEVAAEFEGVLAVYPGDVIGEFGTALDAIYGGVRLASEIGEPGNVDADVVAAGKLRKAEVQTAARKLEAEFVEGAVANDRVVLGGDVQIAGLVDASARAGVLPEYLVLRSGGKAGDERRRNANANKRRVAIVPVLIETRG